MSASPKGPAAPGERARTRSGEAAAARALVGTVLDGRYELTGILGRGGMGVVYAATQKSIRRPVAVKMLHARLANEGRFFERFRREAELASRLQHPNIISLYDFGRTEEGHCYCVMERLEGQSLKALVEAHGPLSVGRTVDLIEPIARALAHAHREGVIHRDLKPHNIMVQTAHDADFVKVLDFGLSKAIDGSPDGISLTSDGEVLGTPRYMPPEQALGESADARSDLHALAATMYFCLTGSPPFGAKTFAEARAFALLDPPRIGSRRGQAVPEDVEAFMKRALAKRPDERFQDADAFCRELRFAVASSTPSELEAEPKAASDDPTQVTRAPGPPPPSLPRRNTTTQVRRARAAEGSGGKSRGSRSARPSPDGRLDDRVRWILAMARTRPGWMALALLPLLLFFLGAGLMYSVRNVLFPPEVEVSAPATPAPRR